MSPNVSAQIGSSRHFTVYEVPSDYMSPTMQPGDLVEIDSAVTRAHADGVSWLSRPACLRFVGFRRSWEVIASAPTVIRILLPPRNATAKTYAFWARNANDECKAIVMQEEQEERYGTRDLSG